MFWWIFCLVVAVAFLAAAISFAVNQFRSRKKKGVLLDPVTPLLAGVVLSAVTLFIPLYVNEFAKSGCGPLETFLISVHNVVRLFVVDGDFSFITNNLTDVPSWIFYGYTVLFSVLFVAAPALTFSFLLTFFKQLAAYKRYVTNYCTDTYVFSELNDKSLALAESLYDQKDEKKLLIFADVFDDGDEKDYELLQHAKRLDAICFKADISDRFFQRRSKKSDLYYFIVGEDSAENTRQALAITEALRDREKTNLYVVSSQLETELLLSKVYTYDEKKGERPAKIQVRRVNEIQSLITRTLYETGYEMLFKSAAVQEDGSRRINAVVLGMGEHGMEMTKTLAWYCQMDGYTVDIHAFDMDAKAEERLRSQCPELLEEKYNTNTPVGDEARYKITVYPQTDVNTRSFDDQLQSLSPVTYVFVALGDDERNIATAVKVRSLLAQKGCSPKIQAVVYSSAKKEALSGVKNFKNQAYDIEFIGDLKTSYSAKVILHSDLEDAAKKRHMKWGNEETFWQFSYNYCSSVASAIHRKAKEECGIPGITLEPKKRNETELWNIRRLEHRRWNAYMRSIGYRYGAERNDLAKMHPSLVPFDDLSLEEQKKDDD